MSETKAQKLELTELQQLDARVLEAERRLIPVIRNFLKMRRTLSTEDPRREATRSALLWCFFSPASAVGAAGVGSVIIAILTLGLAREGNELVRTQLSVVVDQNKLVQAQLTAAQEQFNAQRRAEANRRRGELLVRLFERRECAHEMDRDDCPFAADSQSRVYAFLELGSVQTELSLLEKSQLLGMHGIDLSGIRFPSYLSLEALVATEVDMSYSQLRDMTIKGANFARGKFRRTEFHNVTISYSSFEFADLRGAEFENTHFVGVNFTSANFMDVNLVGVKFVRCNFTSANLEGAEEKQDDDVNWATGREREFYSEVEAYVMRGAVDLFSDAPVSVKVDVDTSSRTLRILDGSLNSIQLKAVRDAIREVPGIRGPLLTLDIQAVHGMVVINDPYFFTFGCINGKTSGIVGASCQEAGKRCQVELSPRNDLNDLRRGCTWDRSESEEAIVITDRCDAIISSLGKKSLLHKLDFRPGDSLRSCRVPRHHELWALLQNYDRDAPRATNKTAITVEVNRKGRSFNKHITVHGIDLQPF